MKLEKKSTVKKAAQGKAAGKKTKTASQKPLDAKKKSGQNTKPRKRGAAKKKGKRSVFGTSIKIALSLIMLVMLGVVGMVFFKYKDDIADW